MAAVAPLRHDHDDDRRQSPLSLVPPLPRSRRRQNRRDAGYAVTLAVLLGVGILGVLLLNTAMQTQADRIATTKQQLADLTLRAQVLQTTADEAESPAVLAARARLLHLRPATRVSIVALSHAHGPHANGPHAHGPDANGPQAAPPPGRLAVAKITAAKPALRLVRNARVSAPAREARRARAG